MGEMPSILTVLSDLDRPTWAVRTAKTARTAKNLFILVQRPTPGRWKMTSLNERIRKGEAAITRAKARGQDVTAWEEHLGKLKALVHVTSSDKTVADVTEGRIVAVEICSEVLQAHIWLAFDDAFDPGDGRAVFYGHELEWLKTKTPEQLQETHKAKLIFGRDTKIKGGSMEEKPKLGSDSEGLGFWSAEIGTVGRVSEVNGAEARDVPEFVPTKHEVIQIAKY